MHVAVEMAPIAKVGGLGDVVTSLSRAVQELGHTVEVVLPKFAFLVRPPPSAASRLLVPDRMEDILSGSGWRDFVQPCRSRCVWMEQHECIAKYPRIPARH